MKAKERIPDVLASRYVSEEMKQNWSMQNKVLLERDFWLAVMHAQKDLGISIPEEALEAYLQVKDCLLYTSPSPRDKRQSRMPSSA